MEPQNDPNASTSTTDVATASEQPAAPPAVTADPATAVLEAAAAVVLARRAITPSDLSRAHELPLALEALEAAVDAASLILES